MSKLINGTKKRNRKNIIHSTQENIEQDIWHDVDGNVIDSQHTILSMMLPPAVKAFYSQMEKEVEQLCGPRYSHGTGFHRWSSQKGSIFLGNQKIALEKPRVRDNRSKTEVPIQIYDRFQDRNLFQQEVFQEGLRKVSQRDYTKGVKKMISSFGVSKSHVSREWVKATKKQLKKLQDRNIRDLDIVALYLDGKRFSKLGVVVALGISTSGRKYVLGIYQASTENSVSCKNLLDDLTLRGLPEKGLVIIVDGGSGLNKALDEKFECHDPVRRRAIRVRCYVHKWRNILGTLNEEAQKKAAPLFWAIRDAETPTEALTCSENLESFLKLHNLSALKTFREAKEDLLSLHLLKTSPDLKRVLSTTNPIESLNSLLEEDLRRVKRWRDSEHFQRWMAMSCLKNEEKMRRVKGYRGMFALKARLQQLFNKENGVDKTGAAA